MLVEILQLVHEISSFPELPSKKAVLENFSKLTGKCKKQSSEGVLSKNMFLKILQKNHRKTFLPESLYIIKLKAENLKLSEAY